MKIVNGLLRVYRGLFKSSGKIETIVVVPLQNDLSLCELISYYIGGSLCLGRLEIHVKSFDSSAVDFLLLHH